MTTEEIVVKVVCGKRIINELLRDSWWRTLLCNREAELLAVTEKILEEAPYQGKPQTDKEAGDYIFDLDIRVRAALLMKFCSQIAVEKRDL